LGDVCEGVVEGVAECQSEDTFVLSEVEFLCLLWCDDKSDGPHLFEVHHIFAGCFDILVDSEDRNVLQQGDGATSSGGIFVSGAMHGENDIDFISGHDEPCDTGADVRGLDGDSAHAFGDQWWQSATDARFGESACQQEFSAGQVIAGSSSDGIFDFADSTFRHGICGKPAEFQVCGVDDGTPWQVGGGCDNFECGDCFTGAALGDEGADCGDKSEDDSKSADENGSGLHV
jgi:hypothetical protein